MIFWVIIIIKMLFIFYIYISLFNQNYISKKLWILYYFFEREKILSEYLSVLSEDITDGFLALSSVKLYITWQNTKTSRYFESLKSKSKFTFG